jgi:hypothetical protein
MFVDFINSDGLGFGDDGSGGGGSVLYVDASLNGSNFIESTLYSGPPTTSGGWSVPIAATSGATGLTISFLPTWPWNGTISISEIRLDQ